MLYTKVGIKTIYGIITIYCGILFPITDAKSKAVIRINIPLIWGALTPANINNDDKRIWTIYQILAVHSAPGVDSGYQSY